MSTTEQHELTGTPTAPPAASLEVAIVAAFPFLIDALGIAVLGLLVPDTVGVAWVFGVQLALLSLFAVFIAYRLLEHSDQFWFAGSRLSPAQRAAGTALSLVVVVTGTVALVTLASSAALRYQPSTQFFQLLSALDIAWAASAVMVAAYWLWGRRPAVIGGLTVVAVCIWAVGNYITVVGFGPGGGWRVRGRSLFELVIVYDMAVAIIAIGLLVYAVKRKVAVPGAVT